jgi:hypothetical protein
MHIERNPFVVMLSLLIVFKISIEQPCQATPIDLNAGIALTLSPGSSDAWTITATNFDNGTSVTNWNAFAIAFQPIPGPGAGGSVSLTGVVSPATNPSITTPSPVGQPVAGNFGAPINGTTAYTGINISYDAAQTTTWASGQTYNLATLTFSASGDAFGTWMLYASNPADDEFFPQTSWLTNGAQDRFFGNVPFNENAATLLLGTISVVPEPSTILLAALGVLCLGAHSHRRWRPCFLRRNFGRVTMNRPDV